MSAVAGDAVHARGGHRLRVGLMLPQTEGMRQRAISGWADLERMARLAEDVGFDSLWVVDHFLYQLQGEDRGRSSQSRA